MKTFTQSVVGICALSVALAGCSSMKATYLGAPEAGMTVDGLPIVVQRPRFLKVTVREVKSQVVGVRTAGGSLSSTSGAQLPGGNPNTPAVTPGLLIWEPVFQGPERTATVVDFDTVSVGEVYALDFKRPGAGTADFSVEFADDAQYPKKLTGNIDDQTIKQVGDTLGSILEKVAGLKPTSGELDELQKKLGPSVEVRSIEVSSTVTSIKIYDLDKLGHDGYIPVVLFP